VEPSAPPAGGIDALAALVASRPRVVALTGAGLSTASGIPDYRDENGAWKRKPPVVLADFVRREDTRRRYWARSLAGWPAFAAARPNPAHDALARLEAAGVVRHVVTQNVDGLHQRAGSRAVTDLHGRLDEVECLGCRARLTRERFQEDLRAANPSFADRRAPTAPDGDADLEPRGLAAFRVPACPDCGGTWKPSVVFFGESVPRERVEEAYTRVAEADLLLVAGTSLMVFSGWRFARAAAERGTPVAIVNLGRTRADDLATLKVAADCGAALGALADRLGA
jgi:NAD-dependent SIR2 family protein deacetylase